MALLVQVQQQRRRVAVAVPSVHQPVDVRSRLALGPRPGSGGVDTSTTRYTTRSRGSAPLVVARTHAMGPREGGVVGAEAAQAEQRHSLFPLCQPELAHGLRILPVNDRILRRHATAGPPHPRHRCRRWPMRTAATLTTAASGAATAEPGVGAGTYLRLPVALEHPGDGLTGSYAGVVLVRLLLRRPTPTHTCTVAPRSVTGVGGCTLACHAGGVSDVRRLPLPLAACLPSRECRP